MKKGMRSVYTAVVIALYTAAVLVQFAAAHADLAESHPLNGALLEESPQRVWARFTQELESVGSTIQVVDGNGRSVDKGNGGLDLHDPDHKTVAVSLPPTLPDGSYTANWQVVSAEDGDETTGVFAFNVGKESNSNQSEISPDNKVLIGWIISAGLIILILAGVFILQFGRPQMNM
jgi:copper transport protein